ncbi:TPA: hypothetical protein ACVU00_001494 [Vibrio cholerae]
MPVEVNLRKQQGQVLKVLHIQYRIFFAVAVLRDLLPVFDDVQVVTTQVIKAD